VESRGMGEVITEGRERKEKELPLLVPSSHKPSLQSAHNMGISVGGQGDMSPTV